MKNFAPPSDEALYPARKDSHSCLIVPTISASEIRAFRRSKNLTQEEFAALYGVHVRTLKNWEGERSTPRWSSVFVRISDEIRNLKPRSTSS